MTGFLGTFLLLLVMVGVAVVVARRRPIGARLTWGEAFVAGLYIYALLFVAYGVVPHQWLAYADTTLKWRSDTIGIPLGPLGGGILKGHFGIQHGRLWPAGIPLPHGRFIVTAQALRDIVASALYGVFLGANFGGWLWWQKRGKKKAEVPELVSAYGRPLVRKA